MTGALQAYLRGIPPALDTPANPEDERVITRTGRTYPAWMLTPAFCMAHGAEVVRCAKAGFCIRSPRCG